MMNEHGSQETRYKSPDSKEIHHSVLGQVIAASEISLLLAQKGLGRTNITMVSILHSQNRSSCRFYEAQTVSRGYRKPSVFSSATT